MPKTNPAHSCGTLDSLALKLAKPPSHVACPHHPDWSSCPAPPFTPPPSFSLYRSPHSFIFFLVTFYFTLIFSFPFSFSVFRFCSHFYLIYCLLPSLSGSLSRSLLLLPFTFTFSDFLSTGVLSLPSSSLPRLSAYPSKEVLVLVNATHR